MASVPSKSHQIQPYLFYPYKSIVDKEGRSYFVNDETKATSWMHPGKLSELREAGALASGIDECGGADGEAWRGWIIECIAVEPNIGGNRIG
jgi:hypothetical protein